MLSESSSWTSVDLSDDDSVDMISNCDFDLLERRRLAQSNCAARRNCSFVLLSAYVLAFVYYYQPKLLGDLVHVTSTWNQTVVVGVANKTWHANFGSDDTSTIQNTASNLQLIIP